MEIFSDLNSLFFYLLALLRACFVILDTLMCVTRVVCVDSSGHGDNESLMAEGLAGRRFPVPSEGATDRQPTLSGMSGSVPGVSMNPWLIK